jgi:hypothetical protein
MSKRQSKRPLHRVEQQRQVQPRMPKLSRPHGLFSCWENELPGLRLPPDHFDSDRHGSLHSRSPGLRPGLGRAALLLAGAGGFGAGPVRILNARDAPFVPTPLTDLALHKGTGRALKWFGRSP